MTFLNLGVFYQPYFPRYLDLKVLSINIDADQPAVFKGYSDQVLYYFMANRNILHDIHETIEQLDECGDCQGVQIVSNVAHKITWVSATDLVLIAYVQMLLINTHADVSSEAIDINLGLSFHLHLTSTLSTWHSQTHVLICIQGYGDVKKMKI